MKVAGETLSVITVFKDLEIRDRQRLAESMSMRSFEPDRQVIAQDDDATNVFFVVSGRVRSTSFATSGKEVSYQDLEAGEMFGEMSAIDGLPRSTYVVALSEAMIATMPRDVFWSALMRYPSVSAATLRRLTSMVRMHCERIFEYSTLGVKNRIHAEFLRLARVAGEVDGQAVVEDPPTHAEIANRISTHREAVTRECKHMESLGLIDWRPGRHVIKDVERLERMVKEVRGH